MEIYGYLASILMGLSLGVLGGGGSILTVPILVYLFKVDAVLATAYSLFIVGLTSLAGGSIYAKKKLVDFKTGFLFAVPSFVGVYITRAFIVPALPETIYQAEAWTFTKPLLIMLTFSALMLFASISMLFGRSTQENRPSRLSSGQRYSLIAAEGLIVGGVTGFVGAGGGFLIIPALVVLVGLPMKTAVGTSLFIIAAKSLIGFTGDLQNQSHIEWSLLFTISAISLVGLYLGTVLSKKLPEQILKKVFGVFVLMMGFLILIDQLTKLS